MNCFKSKQPEFVVAFITGVTDLDDVIEPLDKAWEQAVGAGDTDAILDAKDTKGNTPMNMACLIGHMNKIQWIANKWKEQGRAEDLEIYDELGFTPLIACCYRGFLGPIDNKESPQVKENRLAVVKYLVEECGA